jgi:hypothetical protein
MCQRCECSVLIGSGLTVRVKRRMSVRKPGEAWQLICGLIKERTC